MKIFSFCFIVICLWLLAVSACSTKLSNEVNENSDIRQMKVVVIDSCEYFKYLTSYGCGEITHKGNCKYCAERQRKMIAEELKKVKIY